MILRILGSQKHQAPGAGVTGVVSHVLSTTRPSFQANSHPFILDLACTSKLKSSTLTLPIL